MLEKMECPRSHGFFQGYFLDAPNKKAVGLRRQLPCNSWKCPVCNPKKLRQTRARIYNGLIGQTPKLKGYREKFNQKFLTLTYPGKKFRSQYSPSEALDQMLEAWNKLRTAMKKYYGDFIYLRVMEPQKDGYPHFHVLLIGQSISHFSVLAYIKRLWCRKYKMGFCRLNVKTQNIKHGIRYVTKYMTKNFDNIRRYARLFSASRGALQPIQKRKDWIMSKVYLGKVSANQGCVEVELTRDISPFMRDALCKTLRYRICDDERQVLAELANLGLIGKSINRQAE